MHEGAEQSSRKIPYKLAHYTPVMVNFKAIIQAAEGSNRWSDDDGETQAGWKQEKTFLTQMWMLFAYETFQDMLSHVAELGRFCLLLFQRFRSHSFWLRGNPTE